MEHCVKLIDSSGIGAASPVCRLARPRLCRPRTLTELCEGFFLRNGKDLFFNLPPMLEKDPDYTEVELSEEGAPLYLSQLFAQLYAVCINAALEVKNRGNDQSLLRLAIQSLPDKKLFLDFLELVDKGRQFFVHGVYFYIDPGQWGPWRTWPLQNYLFQKRVKCSNIPEQNNLVLDRIRTLTERGSGTAWRNTCVVLTDTAEKLYDELDRLGPDDVEADGWKNFWQDEMVQKNLPWQDIIFSVTRRCGPDLRAFNDGLDRARVFHAEQYKLDMRALSQIALEKANDLMLSRFDTGAVAGEVFSLPFRFLLDRVPGRVKTQLDTKLLEITGSVVTSPGIGFPGRSYCRSPW